MFNDIVSHAREVSIKIIRYERKSKGQVAETYTKTFIRYISSNLITRLAVNLLCGIESRRSYSSITWPRETKVKEGTAHSSFDIVLSAYVS